MTPTTSLIDPKDIILGAVPDDEEYREQVHQIAESIKSNGLFHKPAIRDDLKIVHGRKRVLAAIEAALDSIEVTVYPSDQDESFYKILSLRENLNRHNLPWYEQVVSEKELHDIRQTEHGVGKQGAKVGWSLRDTATELKMAIGSLSEDIRMAEAVLADPVLRKIKDKMTARRVVLAKARQIQQEYAAQAVEEKYNLVLQGSSEVVLQSFKANLFDVCLTDPPWLEYKDDKLCKDQFTLDVFKEVYRVLKSPGFLYAFVSTADWYIYLEEFKKIGFSVQKWPLIWIKEGVLSLGSRTWEYQRDYEPVILAVKGTPSLTATNFSSIFSCKVVPSVKLTHPNQKPPEVIKKILAQCSYDKSLILDPFGGSGEVAVQARALGRKYVVIERDVKFCAQIKERLK